MNKQKLFIALLAAAVPVVALLPLPDFWIAQLNYIGLYALVCLGLVLLTGVGGLTSFGQAAFVGVGAYTTAWLTLNTGMSPSIHRSLGTLTVVALALVLSNCAGLKTGSSNYATTFDPPMQQPTNPSLPRPMHLQSADSADSPARLAARSLPPPSKCENPHPLSG